VIPPEPIDVVYTWVDGARPDYLDVVRRYSRRPQDLNPERFRDPYQMLRHSLRSVERHAPWVRHIYLFTARPHAPAWLRRDHPRLRLVHHDEVMPATGVLPTFNSNVIETFLHRLPGISARFLYFNDDYFLGAPVTPADFFAPDGRLKLFGTFFGERFRSRLREQLTVSFGFLEHGPLLIDRAEWGHMQELAAAEIAELHRHRFRQPDEVRPDRLYRWHALTHARARFAVEPFWRYLRYTAFHKLTPGAERQRTALAKIARTRPRFFCLNDDLGPHPDPAIVAHVRAFLAELYPGPGSFELPDA
jgi:hypothetical protein